MVCLAVFCSSWRNGRSVAETVIFFLFQENVKRIIRCMMLLDRVAGASSSKSPVSFSASGTTLPAPPLLPTASVDSLPPVVNFQWVEKAHHGHHIFVPRFQCPLCYHWFSLNHPLDHFKREHHLRVTSTLEIPGLFHDAVTAARKRLALPSPNGAAPAPLQAAGLYRDKIQKGFCNVASDLTAMNSEKDSTASCSVEPATASDSVTHHQNAARYQPQSEYCNKNALCRHSKTSSLHPSYLSSSLPRLSLERLHTNEDTVTGEKECSETDVAAQLLLLADAVAAPSSKSPPDCEAEGPMSCYTTETAAAVDPGASMEFITASCERGAQSTPAVPVKTTTFNSLIEKTEVYCRHCAGDDVFASESVSRRDDMRQPKRRRTVLQVRTSARRRARCVSPRRAPSCSQDSIHLNRETAAHHCTQTFLKPPHTQALFPTQLSGQESVLYELLLEAFRHTSFAVLPQLLDARKRRFQKDFQALQHAAEFFFNRQGSLSDELDRLGDCVDACDAHEQALREQMVAIVQLTQHLKSLRSRVAVQLSDVYQLVSLLESSFSAYENSAAPTLLPRSSGAPGRATDSKELTGEKTEITAPAAVSVSTDSPLTSDSLCSRRTTLSHLAKSVLEKRTSRDNTDVDACSPTHRLRTLGTIAESTASTVDTIQTCTTEENSPILGREREFPMFDENVDESAPRTSLPDIQTSEPPIDHDPFVCHSPSSKPIPVVWRQTISSPSHRLPAKR